MTIKQEIMQLKPWFLAARPRTLPICLAPILVGTMLAQAEKVKIDWVLAVLAFLSLVFIQSGTNLINDALDFQKGADNSDRVGPQRMTQSGNLSFEQVLKGGVFCFALAILLGIPLMLAGGWPFFFILSFSIICGYLYTGGPFPFAYYGLGEPFIFVFYGLIAVPALFYLQTGYLTSTCFIAAAQMGFLAMIPNAVNNIRDIASDAKANKKTLAVKFGFSFAQWEITFFSLAPFFIGLLWLAAGKPWLAFFPLIALPIACLNIQTIWRTKQGSSYHESFGKCIMLLFIFSILLSIGCVYRL
ncbi:MAG: 1,4-dihydroxy-2-naphthoate octaprenyltransferase [Candidatus Protochlamydia sp.]|nr:1,4-dihydroxy-2-naphthoate octaprenyltransferase [Candidatus Protochlamydia sp.]